MLLLNYFIIFYQILKVYLFLLLIFTGDILSIDFQGRGAGRREREQGRGEINVKDTMIGCLLQIPWLGLGIELRTHGYALKQKLNLRPFRVRVGTLNHWAALARAKSIFIKFKLQLYKSSIQFWNTE